MLRKSHPLGLEARHSYDELVRYIETDPTKLKFPDRAASYRRNHPFLTQDDGSKAALGEQKRVVDYRMGTSLSERALKHQAPEAAITTPVRICLTCSQEASQPRWHQPAPLTPTRALWRLKA